MKITFKNVKNERFELDVEPTQKVADVKTAIEELKGADSYPKASITLIYKGKTLNDEQTLGDADVAENTFIVVFVKKAPATKAKPEPAAAKPDPSPAPASEPAPPADTLMATESNAAEVARQAPAADAGGEGGAAASGADAFATGGQLAASIKAITEMGFAEAEVQRAMRAAFNNPDRAVEYLMTGIPETAQPQAAPQQEAPPASGGQAPASTDQPAAPAAAPTSAAPNGPNAAPLDMWGAPASGGAAGGGGNAPRSPSGQPTAPTNASAAGGAFAQQLMQNPQMLQQLRQAISQNPEALNSMVQELAQRNPAMAQALTRNQQGLLQMLLGGMAEGDAPGPGEVQIELTEADERAIANLESLGFPRGAVIQAYIACEKNEELAANFLMDQGNDFADDMDAS